MTTETKDAAFPSAIYYRTTKVFEESSFTWTIENVSFITLGEGPGYVTRSPQFPSEKTSKCKWQIEVYPCGYDSQHNDLLSVHLCLKSTTSSKMKTKCVISFLDAKDNELRSTSLEGAFQSSQSNQKLFTNVNRESLFEKVSLSEHDILKLRIKIISAVDDSDEILERKQIVDKGIPNRKLIQDLRLMYLKNKFSDVVIVVKGTEFRAHQNVLAARSQYFEAMLKHETKEKMERRIEIKDMDPDIIQTLLNFIYTGSIEYCNTDKALKILEAADKYALEDLKEMCEEYLIVNMNTSNVLDILNVADVHSALELKSKAIDFICSNKNNFSEVAKYKSSKTNSPILLMEILANMATCTVNEKSQK